MKIEIGFGTSLVTPGLGVYMAGYFEERRSTAVHDELYARGYGVQRRCAEARWLASAGAPTEEDRSQLSTEFGHQPLGYR